MKQPGSLATNAFGLRFVEAGSLSLAYQSSFLCQVAVASSRLERAGDRALQWLLPKNHPKERKEPSVEDGSSKRMLTGYWRAIALLSRREMTSSVFTRAQVRKRRSTRRGPGHLALKWLAEDMFSSYFASFSAKERRMAVGIKRVDHQDEKKDSG